MEFLSQEVLLLTIPHLCRSPLEALSLTGSWLISPVLFNGTAPFPNLQNLNIDAAMLTYDGPWYYTGDYSSMNCHLQYSAEDTERGKAMLNGQEPHHLWRTEPDPEMFGALMKSTVEAMNRMPRLLLLEFCVAMHPTGDHGILFMCSETQPAVWEERHGHIELARAAKWEVSDEILELWREHLGWEETTLLRFELLEEQGDILFMSR